MTDTVHVQDLFNGSAGTLDGHVPNIVASGTATYSTPTHYVLDGSGGCQTDQLATSIVLLTISSIDYIQGIYIEWEVVIGRYGAAGTGPTSMAFAISAGELPSPEIDFNGPHGDAFGGNVSRLRLDTTVGSIDKGSTTGLFAVGDTVVFRMDIDQYAKTSTFSMNGTPFHTQDDSAWYSGSETFDPGGMLVLFNDATSSSGGSVLNSYTRLEIGTLGLAGGGGPVVFWTNRVGALEFP